MLRNFDQRQVTELLRNHRESLCCWEVGLMYGSMLRFEMGEKNTKNLSDGSQIIVGKCRLTLEADDWKIETRDKEIVNAKNVTREVAESIVMNYFCGEALEKIEVKDSGDIVISFSDNLFIIISSRNDIESGWFYLYFSDGMALEYNKTSGYCLSIERRIQ